MEKTIANILTNEGFVNGVEFKEENIYEIEKFDCYEGYNVSENGNVAIMLRVVLDSFNSGDGDIGYIQEVAYFTNFLEVLGEADMSITDFNAMPINEKLEFLAEEGASALTIIGEDIREKEFVVSKYITE